MTQEQPFYPPRIQPSAKPLRFPFYLPKLVTNNLETIPVAIQHNSWGLAA